MNSRLHFKRNYVVCAHGLVEASVCIGLSAPRPAPFFHRSRQHPPPPAPVSLNSLHILPKLHRQLPPSPDPQQNPIRGRHAQPGRVPALQHQPYLRCRSQHAAARASPSSFARHPPSTISILYPSPLLPGLHKNLSVTALHRGESYFLVIHLPIWFCMFPNWL